MTTRIKLRRDTAANWTTANPILAAGEPGLESDTGKIKYGDGVSRWNLLEHTGGDTLINEGAITVQTGDADRWFVRLRKEDDSGPYDLSGIKVHSTNYDSDGNVLIIADFSFNATYGLAVFKFTPAGELVWKQTVGPSNTYATGSENSVVDGDDNLVFTLNQDNNIAVVVKINGATGAVMFSNTIDFGVGYSLRAIGLDSNENIIIGGDIAGVEQNIAFVAKLNTDATTITWQKILIGDSSDSFILGLAVDFNDDIVVTGVAEVGITVNGSLTPVNAMLVAKVTSAGNLAWQKTVALENETPGGIAAGVSLDSIGNIYVTGSYYVDNPTADNGMGPEKKSNTVVIFKMTALGAIVWDRRVGPGPCSWVGTSTAVGDDGDLYLYAGTYELNPLSNVEGDQAGYYTTRLVLARYNKTTGAVIWQSYFDNPLAQDLPGETGDNGPFGSVSTDLMTVKGNKILIGGSVRFGQSNQDLNSPWGNGEYFNQGFIAQFDTDATKFSAEGWELKTSRIPGLLTNTLVASNGPLALTTDIIDIITDGSATVGVTDADISVRRTASKVNTWTFGKDGTLTAPVDGNIKLQQTQLGFAAMYGQMNQSTDDGIWYNSVCHDAEGNAYTLGANNWTSNKAHIQKFSPEGNLLWNRELRSGSGASFDVTSDGSTYTGAIVNSTGGGYKVGDKIVIRGSDLSGSDGLNSLILEVATISNAYDYVGAVETVVVVSGVVALNVPETWINVRDSYEDAYCTPVAMAFDPATGNIAVLVETPTYNGDTLDAEWTEAVVLMIDSGSGAVVKSFTLSDEGDIYGYDIAVSATGKPAVVGQKFNEYKEYGSITPLAGSGTDVLWVSKTDIDSEHFPGEAGSNISDWWVTGSGITDQVQAVDVNYYYNVPVSAGVQTGSGLVVDVTVAGGAYTLIATNGTGTGYKDYQKFRIFGNLLGGVDGVNDLTFKVGVDGSGTPNVVTSIEGTPTGSDRTVTELTPVKVPGSGAGVTVRFSPTDGTFQTHDLVQGGDNYLVGDTIIIPGTALAGGQAPANNIIFTVVSVSSGSAGSITSISYTSGAHPSTHLSIETDDNVNFAAEETFAIKQNLGGEAFIWTPDFTKAIGANTNDQFNGVVWDSTGANVYVVGHGRYEVNYDQGLVVKYSSTGTLIASKYINNNLGNESADKGTVALMADNSIVVVHQMYNNDRDETDEVLVTKLDSDLAMVWQKTFLYDAEGDGNYYSPSAEISVAVDPATDEIVVAWSAYESTEEISSGDNAVILLKLDTDGQIIWKRAWAIYESDVNINDYGNGNRALSIHGDKFTFVGDSDGPDDDTSNAMIVTLPLDGTGTGQHDFWKYVELNDLRIRVQDITSPTSTTFTPNVNTGGISDTENVKYYFTDYPNTDFTLYPIVIRSNEGGAVEFADGSKQTFSAAVIPQVRSGGNRYWLRPEDSGRHILVESTGYSMRIPNWERVTLPVGYTVTIINISGSELTIVNEETNNGIQGEMWWSGNDMKTSYVGIDDNGSGQMVTLVKIKEGTRSDSGDDHGDIWMIAGADLSNND